MIPVGSIILLIATYAALHSLWSKEHAELHFPANPVHEDIITLSHAGLQAHDLEKALEFYVKYFGLQEAFRLYNDDGSLRLVYITFQGIPLSNLLPGLKSEEKIAWKWRIPASLTSPFR